MKFSASLVAFAATVLLHLGFVAAVVHSLAENQERTVQQAPVSIELVRQAQAASEPTPPAASPAPPPQQDMKPAKAKPRVASKPEAAPHVTATAPAAIPPTAFESKSQSAASAAISPPTSTPTHATSPPIAQPAQPTRTGASEAAYASSNRPPPYPRLSRVNEEEGRVVLRVLVKADGTAGEVEILASSGYRLLDESARTTVQTWRFKPATIDGKPVAEWYQVPIPFKLQNN